MMKHGLTRMMQLAVASLACTVTHAQPSSPPSRGEMLYTTHCIACHTSQMHWRDKRQATDWESLQRQVRRWQANAGLRWSEDDIVEVARYLNETIYRYPQTSRRVSLAAAARRGTGSTAASP